MIDFTIKTLDSNNHPFCVDDDITVKELKEKVRDSMGIEINLQRLIFCGRVMQDEKRLSEYDVKGKVVHLVQRAPPSPESRNTTRHNNHGNQHNPSGSSESGSATQQQIRRLMVSAMTAPPSFVVEEQQALNTSPTTGRLEFIRRMIGEIKTTLAQLRGHVHGEENSGAPASSEAQVDPVDNEQTAAAREENVPPLDENGEEAPDAATRAQNARRRAMRALRARHSRPRDLGQLIDDLEALQEQFAPYRTNYIGMLRAANNPEPPQFTDEERQRDQLTVEMVTDIIHSFGHAYHAVSDINFQVGQRNPRLTSEGTARHPMPMQAHINVMQPSRRGHTATASGFGHAPATQTSATARSSSVSPTTASATSATASAITVTTASATSVSATTASATSTFTASTVTSASTIPSAPPADQNGQRTHTTQADFENLFRGLGQTGVLGASVGGVEVVMSMEEIPQGGNLPPVTGIITTAQPAGTAAAQQGEGAGNTAHTSVPQFGADIYLGAMPWVGGAPSADLLQNIVSTVIRQGLVSGVEGVAVHAHPLMPQQVAQMQAQLQAQAQAQTAERPQAQASERSQARSTMPSHMSFSSEPLSNSSRSSSIHIRRPNFTPRSQTVSINNLIYDRYLPCDSIHARRRLQRRRDQHQQQVAAQERVRVERASAVHIQSLRNMDLGLTDSHMETILQLIHSTPSQEAWLNALLVVIARQLFLSGPLHSVPGDFAIVPAEFYPLRLLLRNYIQDLVVRSGGNDGANAFQHTSDFFVSQYADFIASMNDTAPIRPEIDVYATIQALIRSRMPAVIAAVMAESTTESFAARFYSVFSRVFIDLCSAVAYCCEDGIAGLQAIFSGLLEEITQDLDDDIRRIVAILSIGSLTHVINNHSVSVNMDAIRRYVRRRDGVLPSLPLLLQNQIPMEVSPPSPPVRDAPMSSPPISIPRMSRDVVLTPIVSNDPGGPALEIVIEPADACPIHESQQAANRNAAAAVNVPIDESAPQSPNSSARTPRPEKTETSSSQNSSEPRFVPPMLLLQHWGEEWVPVFTRDQQAQRDDPPEQSYSDAYLSGMPSRKRRRVRQARPPTTLDAFMNESMREVSDRITAPTGNSAIRTALREHMRNITRSRASSSDDYDPRLYASAERFLNVPKSPTTKPEQPDNSSEPK